jgi:phosphoribosyl-ATP pyrophosphohydrolase
MPTLPNGMPDFTPNPKYEHARGALEAWSEANWARLPALIRRDVEEHLRLKLHEEAPELLAKWRDQHARGISIGSDDPWFHMGAGMAVRNACREQLLDEELPPVTVDCDGTAYHASQIPPQGGNWDDYYFGVLAAIAS